MPPTADHRGLLFVGAVSLAATLLPGILLGQSTPPPLTKPQFGIGYVANAPDAILGASAYVLVPEFGPISGGIGLYVDAKFDLKDPSDERGFNPDVTTGDILNDPDRETADFVKDESTWWSVNLAVVRPLTPFLMAYVGGGMARMRVYDLFNVALTDPVGVGGVVWAENPDKEETRVNFMVGVLLRLSSRISTQFGFETQPQGLSVGASLRLPKW